MDHESIPMPGREAMGFVILFTQLFTADERKEHDKRWTAATESGHIAPLKRRSRTIY